MSSLGALQDIIEAWRRWASEPLVLATVVDVRGSSYRRPGARMVMRATGERVGMISGGCLERDVVRHAWVWTESGPSAALYDTHSDALHPFGLYGTGCEGLVELLLERLVPGQPNVLAEIAASWETQLPAHIMTVYGASEAWSGYIGRGERLPSELIDAARGALAAHRGRAESVTLRRGGEHLSVLLERIAPPVDVLIFGSGDDAVALCRLVVAMGWRARIASTRPTDLSEARFPGAQRLDGGTLPELVARVPLHAHTRVVVMTHHVDTDVGLLAHLLPSPVASVGLLGPKRRTMSVMRALHERSELPASQALAKLETPVGLDLGGDSPEEVALAVVAGLCAAIHGREGGPLSARQGGIHDAHRRRTLEVP